MTVQHHTSAPTCIQAAHLSPKRLAADSTAAAMQCCQYAMTETACGEAKQPTPTSSHCCVSCRARRARWVRWMVATTAVAPSGVCSPGPAAGAG